MNAALPNRGSALISMAAVVVVVYGMQSAKVILVPFLIAAFIALMTARPMLWMQRHRVPAIVAALLIVTTILLFLAVIGTIVGRSVADFTAALPIYQQRLDALVADVLELIAGYVDSDEGIESLGDLVNPGWAMGLAASFLNAIRDVLTNVFLIVFTVIFILLEASTLRTKVEAAFTDRAVSVEGARQFLNNLGRYLGIKTLVSMATGMLAWLLTMWIGVDYPMLWGMLAFLLNYVPTIGSIIAAVPPVLLALVQLGVGEASGVMLGYIAINVAFGNLIEPRILGYGVGISPLVVFVGLIFWGWVFGPVGMLLSVPLTMTLKLGLESDESTRWIAVLIGSQRDAQHTLVTQSEEAS